MENLTGGTPPVRYLLCVVPCKLYFIHYYKSFSYCLDIFLSSTTIIFFISFSHKVTEKYSLCLFKKDFHNFRLFLSFMRLSVYNKKILNDYF